ncbi:MULTISPECIES: alpha-galactosidase [Paraburkholderia]|uniref:alpha-galactosidase n=1 Tax=Paraburkholderia TaxID=1822464 RepID=UPI00224DD8CD|nr:MULTISPECIES: alpha-galactosidase [Paraburkholderia]MCX4161772.1 alpha-galactosidase [Paraburkholderia megapolitana]MDN7157269.1 alpha-galactosidase [Paraburkholderia sp. CHISQ3]MDQ6494314.1 alpha-galactosidase [Paraburkholderia megapolitana]
MHATRLIHLTGDAISLVLEPNGALPVWRHFGAKLGASADPLAIPLSDALADAWPAAAARPLPPTILANDPPLTLLPIHGLGWFNQPALAGSRPASGGDLDWVQDFREDDLSWDEHALRIALSDDVAGLGLTLSYTLNPTSGVVSAWAEIENRADTPFRLDWLAAACVPLAPGMDQVLGFSGRWTLEFQENREPLGIATWRRDNRRGRTSHDCFPGIIVGSTLAADDGPVLGAHLGWSGNHTMLIEPLADGRRQLQIGEWLAPGEVVLEKGARYRTPTAYLSFSTQGLNALSAGFHQFVRAHVLAWPGGTMTPRPVHLNTWEAVYCEHDPDDLKSLASAAARLGVERFVLDDGWFHRRDNDRAALGDWWPDARKYPQGLAPLVDHVRGLGMQFGLWVEPEMVNPDSDLYRGHPDWAMQLEGRPLITGRNQLVLDLANPAVANYLFATLGVLLREYPIAYLKWDMNRDLAAAGHRGRAAYRRQTEAYYRLLARLRDHFPALEIESCASGGGRADFGALQHTHRIWTSDSNDALTRIGIQRGFTRFFPPEIMGAHIGPADSHTTGRRHSMAFRAAVALPGHLGLEMDVRLLDADERAELTRWIALFKEWRGVAHSGTLRQGDIEPSLAWVQIVARDLGAALVTVYRRFESANRYIAPLLVQGLDAERRYRVKILHMPVAPHFAKPSGLLAALADEGVVLSGATLRDLGLPVPPLPPESAVVFSCVAVDD